MCYREINLFNYMPLYYLDSFFSKGIYFGSISSFNDSLEGVLFHEAVLNGDMDKDILNMAKMLTFELSKENIEKCRSLLTASLEDSNKFISCWHHNDKFSDHMWKNYASKNGCNGVYIKTTNYKVFNAISNEHKQFFEYDGSSFLFHKINYISLVSSLESDVIKNIVTKALALHYKKDVWALENEYRMIINAYKLNIYTGLLVDGCSEVITSEIKKISEEAIKKITVDKKSIYIPIDPMKMIVEIGVKKDGYEKVCQICKKYGINSELIHDIKV